MTNDLHVPRGSLARKEYSEYAEAKEGVVLLKSPRRVNPPLGDSNTTFTCLLLAEEYMRKID
jgi:hypothetical protein